MPVKIVLMLLRDWLLKIVKIKNRIEYNLHFRYDFLFFKYLNIYFQHSNRLLTRPKHCNYQVEPIA